MDMISPRPLLVGPIPISFAVVLNTAACCTVALSDQAAIKNKVLSFQVAAGRCYLPTNAATRGISKDKEY